MGVYNIFNGTQPSPDVINRIANVTHVSVDYLLGRSEAPNIAGGYSPIGIIDFPVIATVRAGYGEELVEENISGRWNRQEHVDVEYPLPATMTDGKETITVTFRSRTGTVAGGIFNVRILKK